MSVSLALIGTGKWGSTLRKNIENMSSVTLTYQASRQWKELLVKEDIDGVIIATPPSTHAEIALAWITKGIPVFIEKPMTLSSADAKQIVLSAKEYDVPVQVGHVHLYNSAFQTAKEISKDVGPIRFLIGEGSNNGPYREDYSALWDWAPHDISMMLYVMGEMPTQVSAWGASSTRPSTTLWDSAHLSLTFPSGTIGYITSSWLHPIKKNQLTIIGENSSIIYDNILDENKVTLYENMGPYIEGTSITSQEPIISYPLYELDTPVMRELEAFIDTIQNKTLPVSDAVLGAQVVLILEKVEESILKSGFPSSSSSIDMYNPAWSNA